MTIDIRPNSIKWTLSISAIIYFSGMGWVSGPDELFAQGVNLGSPPIWNYSRKIYKAGNQNWDAAEDSLYRMYFANNDGLLRYDGTYWETYPVANQTIVRSVAIAEDGRIYVGAQSELGFFYPDERGELRYISLVGLLPPDERFFEDVWDIALYQDGIYFRTNRQIFEYSGKEMIILQTEGELNALFSTPLGLILQHSLDEISVLQGDRFVATYRLSGLESAMTGVIPWIKDTVVFTSLKNGLWFLTRHAAGPWITAQDEFLKQSRIYCATSLKDGKMALGTSLDGLIVLDRHRREFRHLTKKDGLQNNNVLHTYGDQAGNLWLGLDNGIDCVVLDSRFSTVFPDDELQGTGYAAIFFDEQLYLGVSNGAYKAPWQNYYDPRHRPYFQRVPGAEGQVWGFSVIDNQLLMGHHEGGFHIREDRAYPMTLDPGTWTYVQLNDRYMMAGTYNGLVLYQKSGDQWVKDQAIKGIQESCRIMVRDEDGSIWISHPYRGLYHVNWTEERKHDPGVKFFDQSGGLPSNLNNYVFTVSGRAVFGTEKGVYRYDRTIARFLPDTTFNKWIGEHHRVKYLKEDLAGNIWYVTGEEVGRLSIRDYGLKKEVSKTVFPELSDKLVGGFEFIYPVDQDNMFFGTEEGFIHFDAHGTELDTMVLHLVLHNIRTRGDRDSFLVGGYRIKDWSKGATMPLELGAHLNSLSFSFSATEYKSPHLVEYRTWLEGLEKDWTTWSSDTRRDYSTLGPGDYIFHAQARLGDHLQSNEVSFPFYIRPPWYKSRMAMTLYGLGIIGLFTGFILRQRKRFESEKARMAVTHQEKEAQAMREAAQSKAALSEIQNEKLEVEIKYKNQELAMTTMHLVQKAEILLSVQEALQQIQQKAPNQEVNKEIQQLINLVNFDVKLDEDWEHFAHHFDQVHVDFLKNLKERFPQLSASDLKLCAYLRMNLSTKEIAPLLNISVRGVEGSRYRLRKKLHLPNDANLTEFILGINS